MKESKTLGLRIQEGRKAAGLSQEALGEKLQVSRQAVSKWEADAAIPELENLIAMSRLFGVSVGTLLGVEEPAAQEPMTERELAAVETIAAKYAAEQKKGGRRWLQLLPILTAAAAVLLCVQLSRQITTLENRITSLQSSLSSVRNEVSVQIASAVRNIGSTADTGELLDADVQITDFDPQTQTVTLRVTARPRERRLETTASFTATLDDGQHTREAVLSGDSFAAEEWVLPMSSNLDITVSFKEGNSIRTSQVKQLFDCAPEDFRLSVEGSWESQVTRTWNPLTVKLKTLTYDVWGPENDDAVLAPAAIDLCLYRNDQTEPEQVIPVAWSPGVWEGSGRISAKSGQTAYHTAFVLDRPNEQMVAAIRVTDTKGQESYYITGVWATDANVTSTAPKIDWDTWTPGTFRP